MRTVIGLIFIFVCELSAALCTAFLLGKPLFLLLQERHLWQRMNLHLHSNQCEKTNKWAGNMLMFHVDVNMKWLGIRFKNGSFQ